MVFFSSNGTGRVLNWEKLGNWMMAAVNPQPLQARPFEENVAGSFQMEDDEGEYEDGGDDAMEEEEEDVLASSVSVAERGRSTVTASRTSELTLSFEGEVYVFPAVTPEKVSLFHSKSLL